MNEQKKAPPINNETQPKETGKRGLDRTPEEKEQAIPLLTEDGLKGKKVDGDPEQESDQPTAQK